MESNGLAPTGNGQPAEHERVIRCEMTLDAGEGCCGTMGRIEQKKAAAALRALETKLRASYDRPNISGEDTTTSAGQAFFARQLNTLRAALAEQDQTIGLLFPDVPGDLAPMELATIAGQLAEYIDADLDDAQVHEVHAKVTCDEPAEERSTGAGQPSVHIKIGDGVVFGDMGPDGIGGLIRQALASCCGAVKQPEKGEQETE